MEALFTTITFEKPPGVGTPNGFRYTPEGSSLSQNLLYHLREQLASDFSLAVIFVPKSHISFRGRKNNAKNPMRYL
jgi:hypothetical protein